MKKKIFNLFLIVLMAFIFSPIITYAAETVEKPDGAEWLVNEEENYVWYKLTENTPTTNPVSYTLIIGGSGKMPDWDATTYATQPWREHNITDVVIENGITNIGVYSFILMSSIKNVSFPNSLTEIGTAAFHSCDLKSITLNEGLTTIDAGAFNSNSNLIEVIFPTTLTSIGMQAFQYCDIRDIVLYDGLTTIGANAFSHSENLKQLILPSTLTSIGNQAFRNTSLETIISYNSTPPSLGNNIFVNLENQIQSSIKKVIIPYSAKADYINNNKWNAVFDAGNVSVEEAYIIKTNISGEGKGTVIPSVKHILVNEYDSQKIDLIINPSTDSRLKSLTVLDENEEEILVTNNSFTMPAKNVTINAIFEIKKLNVEFNSNGGSEVNSQEIKYEKTIIEPSNPTKTGYTFAGWYQDITLSIPFDFDTPITDDVTLYAKWTANEYNITITTNDEDMGTASADLIKAVEGINVSLTSLAKTGYHFVKWESEDVTITNNKFTMPTKNVTIKAIFEEDEVLTYKVSFDKNGGTGSMDDVTGLTGTYTLPENEFVAPDGKQFKGWSLSNDGEIVTKLNIDEDKIVYAIWEDIPEDYSYEFKKGDKQELTIDNIDSFTFTIDGDYSLFDSLKIGNLDLIKDEDYIVTEGSTIITFTNKGIAKLNTLEKGTFDILVTYSNGKNVTGSLILNKILPQEPDTPNPKTGDNISYYIIIGITSLLGLIGSAFYVKKKLY